VFAVRIAKLLLFLMIIPLAPTILRAQTPEVMSGAEDAIARAKVSGGNQKFDEAVNILKHAAERYPTNARVYLALANWQELRGLAARTGDISPEARAAFRHALNQKPYAEIAREIFETYGTAAMFVTDLKDIRTCLNDLTREEFPTSLGEYGVLALPGDPTPVTFTLSDPNLPTDQRGVYQGLITSRPLPVPFITDPAAAQNGAGDQPAENISHYRVDPKYGADPKTYGASPKYGGWKFDYMLLAYEYNRDKRDWSLRFRVLWQQVPGQQEQRAKLAQQTALVLLRDSALLHAYAGLANPRFAADGAINVWLAEKGDAGGESYNDSIYLQEVGTPRSPTEWVREISHEFSHQAFPVVGGYTQPEWGANGFMGERLFLRWLLENRRPQDDQLTWLNNIDAQEVKETRLDRPMRQFAGLERGPEAPAMRAGDRKAMDSFIGMACYLELTRGGIYLANELKSMTSPSYAGDGGFLSSIVDDEIHLQSIDHPTIVLHLTAMPLDIPLWVYLRSGSWQGVTSHADAIPVRLTAEIDGKAVRTDDTGAFFASRITKGWHCIKLAFEGNAATPLTELKLTRRGD